MWSSYWSFLEPTQLFSAQYALRIAYDQGIAQNNVKAHTWLNIEAIKGTSGAIKNREDIAKKMTPAQIAEAQEAANRCIKQNFKNCD